MIDTPVPETVAPGVVNLIQLSHCDEYDADAYDQHKNSIAVVVSSGDYSWVMFYEGADIQDMIENMGSRDAYEIGIHHDEPGLWIWEGRYQGGGYDHYTGDCNDPDLMGTHRRPTDDEWAAIREGKCPWNPRDWLINPTTVH